MVAQSIRRLKRPAMAASRLPTMGSTQPGYKGGSSHADNGSAGTQVVNGFGYQTCPIQLLHAPGIVPRRYAPNRLPMPKTDFPPTPDAQHHASPVAGCESAPPAVNLKLPP